ncbi:ankyrin repeat domain-containing protein [Leucothrix arctica]|uniref:Uncharacterized protein n=1 Tax=Leucothrix arctica TaxID=1481894 RepID=A0A317C7L3_9GAMM|nr:ankyrin repeat domain-containing protein [Leucothrix arctica]PWQ94287.1 hypothetical protein DKT75_16130 [Leucothrix arctica]
MLSRYLNSLHLKPMALMVALAVPVSASGNVLLDTNGKPLPDDFSALIELLDGTNEAKRKVLGLSTEKAESVPLKEKKVASEVVKNEKITKKSKVASSSAKTVNVEAEEEVAPESLAPKKNPAHYDADLARRLYDALAIGDAARVKWMLQSGAGNVYVSDTNDTSLRLAIRKGWASVVRVLLERDPDLEHELSGKVNLLHEASVKGAYDIAKMLIAAGLDPEAKTSKNWSNLHLAARYGHVDLIRYYLSLGLDPDARNSEGNTAHWLANHLRHYQAAGYLASRTNVSSYQIFEGKDGKKMSKKKRAEKLKEARKTARKSTPAFTPAQIEAILSQ